MTDALTTKKEYQLKQDLRNKTKLHQAARDCVVHLEQENKGLKEENKKQSERIAELEAVVATQSLQTEELRTVVFGKKKKRTDTTNTDDTQEPPCIDGQTYTTVAESQPGKSSVHLSWYGGVCMSSTIAKLLSMIFALPLFVGIIWTLANVWLMKPTILLVQDYGWWGALSIVGLYSLFGLAIYLERRSKMGYMWLEIVGVSIVIQIAIFVSSVVLWVYFTASV